MCDLISDACSRLYLELSTCDQITQDTCWYQSVNSLKDNESVQKLYVWVWDSSCLKNKNHLLSLAWGWDAEVSSYFHILEICWSMQPCRQTVQCDIFSMMQGLLHRSRSWWVQSVAALTEFHAFNRNWFLQTWETPGSTTWATVHSCWLCLLARRGSSTQALNQTGSLLAG